MGKCNVFDGLLEIDERFDVWLWRRFGGERK